MTTEANKELENIKKDLAELKKDIRDLTGALTAIGKKQKKGNAGIISRKKEVLLDTLSLAEIKKRLVELTQEGDEALDVVRKQVEKYPTGTLLASVGVCVLIGILLGNRR